MIPILIDTGSLEDEFSLSDDNIDSLIDRAVKDVASEFIRLWEQQANRNLKSTRQRYVRNLSLRDEGAGKASAILRMEDPLVHMIENGTGAFDMKKYFSRSPKAKKKKDGGWYLTIPFRFSAPDSLGESEVFTSSMPKEVHSIISKKEPDREIEGGSLSSGIKMNELPSKFRVKKKRYAVSNIPESKTFQEYKNKTSIYAGIVKSKDSDTGQNRYVSFRRVSNLSDPNSFIHSGINAYNLSQKALEELDVETRVDLSIDNFLFQMGFE